MGDEKTLFFQKIDDCLLDEKKVVTYKWLSQFLNIHVNQAKVLLAEYAEALDQHLRQQLEVTYAIGGKLKGKHGFSFKIVKKEHLAKTKELFSIVTTEHVYSLEMMPLPDLNYLFTVDYVEGDLDQGYQGAIECKRSIKTTTEENFARRLRINPNLPHQSTSADYEPMDIDEGPAESRKRSPSRASHSSEAVPAGKRPKQIEYPAPKVPDLFSKAKANNKTLVSGVPATVNTGPKFSSSMTASNTADSKTSSTSVMKHSSTTASATTTKATVAPASKTTNKPTISAKGKAGANTKVKKSKKIFGDTPERRVQTSLTAFFKKD